MMTTANWPNDKITQRRMHFAEIIDAKNPQACWADLVGWALQWTDKKDVHLNRCKDNMLPCWCGKFQ